MKLTFFGSDIELVFEKALKNLADMLNVGALIREEDQYVIQVDKDKPVKHVSKDVVNQGLEDTKQHDQVFIISTWGGKTCFPFILILSRWYAFLKFSLVKILAPFNSSQVVDMRGRGYLILMVMFFRQ